MRVCLFPLLVVAGSVLLPASLSHANKATQPASLAERTAAVLGDKRLPRKLTPKAVAKRLEPLVALGAGNQTKRGLEFTATGNEVRWVHVLYQQDERYYGKDLYLSHVIVALRPEDGDLDKLVSELKTRLSARLGKLGDGDLWRLNNGYQLTIKSGAMKNPLKPNDGDEKVVQLEIAPWVDD